MNKRDPKLTALMFNECINGRDIEGLSDLMTEDHVFIDRAGATDKGKDSMTKGWREFFASFPEYRNIFHRVQSQGDKVILLGYAYWSEENPHDSAIWTARIEDDLVAEWRIFEDTEENRKVLDIS